MNFNYSIQAKCIFVSRIIYKKLNANHKIIFRKFEREIKVYYYYYYLNQHHRPK